MTDTTTDKKTDASPSPDQISGAVYQLGRLYELWTQDRTDLTKRVSQLETQNERLEHILSRFATVDEDFRRTLRELIEKEVNRLGLTVGETVGKSSANAAKNSLSENTQRFKVEIDNATHTIKNISGTLSTYNRWTIATLFFSAVIGGLMGGWAIHTLTQGYRLSSEEVTLLNKGNLYRAASAYLTEEEQNRIYGLATEGKDYDKKKKSSVKPDKKGKKTE